MLIFFKCIVTIYIFIGYTDVFKSYIGNTDKRLAAYKECLVGLLNDRECHTIIDVACGTGYE